MTTQRSIAVLPFENLSEHQDNAYLADGISEEIILALSKVQGLKVTARTSSFAYRDRKTDVRIMGNRLGVATILDGSLRKIGNRIRISAQLVRTDNGFHLWSDRFDRELEDIFELQDEISLLIAEKIRENYGHLEIDEHLVTSKTSNIKAYEQFLRGRFFQLNWNKEDFYKALEYYKRSIQLDASYSQPYFGLVQCYGILGSWGFMDKDEALEGASLYLTKGLVLQPNAPEAYFARATQDLWVNWDPYQALEKLHAGLAIVPQDTELLESAAEAYTALGRFEDAMALINQALEFNPLSPNHHYTKGNIYYLQRQYDHALDWMEKALAIDNKWDLAIRVKACCLILKKDRPALDEFLSQLSTDNTIGNFTLLYDALYTNSQLAPTQFIADTAYYLPWAVYAPLYTKQTEQALQALKTGIELRNGQYINFSNDPLLAPLADHVEFRELRQHTFPGPGQQAEQKKTSEKPSSRLSDLDIAKHKATLSTLMEEEQVFLNPNLSLRDLAASIGIHPNKLSWLLNEALGHNFNEYINSYRLKAFQGKVLQPEFSHFSILGLAYECGFNSKSVFNDFFKKSTGQTPSAWIKMHQR